MKLRCILFSMLLCVTFTANAQTAVGEWTSYMPYNNVTSVEETPNKIFAIGDNHLFSISKSDSEVIKYSKVDGLSEDNVKKIKYDWNTGKLVIAYSNSNIDIIDADGNIFNIADILEKSLSADKTINNITFYNNDAYLSAGFGIVVLNLKKLEVKNTYVIGDGGAMSAVYDLTTDGTNFYALVDNAILQAPVKGVNLLDYNNWVEYKNKLPDSVKGFESLTFFSGCFVLEETDGNIYKSTDTGWEILISNDTEKNYVHTGKDHIIAGVNGRVSVWNEKWELTVIYSLYGVDVLKLDNIIWTACMNLGVLKYNDTDSSAYFFMPDGPLLKYSQKIQFDNGIITVAPGFSWIDRGYRQGAVMLLDNGKWTVYDEISSGVSNISPDGMFKDVVSIAVDPKNKEHVFVSTWGEGVYEFLNGKAVKLYNAKSTNGVLKSVLNDTEYNKNHYVRVDGLAYDKNGNLWALNSVSSSQGSYNCVVYMTPDNVWHEASGYSPLETCAGLRKIIFHSNGQHWILSARSTPGIMVKSDKGSKFFRELKYSDNNVVKSITPTYIYDLAEDKNGDVWIGTSEGPIIYNNCSNVLDTYYTASRIKISRNDGSGLADYLLDGIPVTAIAVDGGNRKWIGTNSSGVYLISADGQTTYHNFTTENSPMPSNDVSSIAINSNTGEVYIGTAEGIVCYNEGTIEPVKKMDSNKIHVYPNPVTPDYKGMITVVGLEKDTEVKITDASGHVVYDGKSFGGSLSWNGKNYAGTDVSAGVYFFHLFNTDTNNSRSAAAKVLIIR
ncbi:MAG: T9SS type A sorting domain-containing protein [Paludibacteraceae bacterium]|nr:T9SS type A sorting domain-containing protein [Paludibacteraceae bacterium]